MGLSNGTYRTAAGSRVTVAGKHGGEFTVDFDWLEEGGCIECEVDPVPEEYGPGDFRLMWRCAYHDSGNSKLIPTEEKH